MNNIKVANINVHIKSFFSKWVSFTAPFHKLSNQEQQVLALLLYYHYKLSREITNNKILWKEVFDYDTKLLITEELSIKDSALQNILTKLRKKKVILEGEISPLYIPNLEDKASKFTITFNFNIIHE